MMSLRKSAVSELRSLLETQYLALLRGELDQLGKLEAKLTNTLVRLRHDGAAKQEIQSVRTLATRNATLIAAAQSGVASARAVIEGRVAQNLTTYDAQGRSQPEMPAVSRTLARG